MACNYWSASELQHDAVMAWIDNYIPLFYVEMITCPRPNFGPGLNNISISEKPQGPLLSTWINFSMDNHMHSKMWDEITYQFLNLHRWRLGVDK